MSQHNQSPATDQRPMLISEIYHSRQGEGLLTGTPSVFVRTSGCNLRCTFCDTPFASWNPTGEQMSIEAIVDQVHAAAQDARHIVLTGGEPMLPREIGQLCEEFKRSDFHITIETAGTIYRQLRCDLMSISPKFSNSDPDVERAGEWLKKHQFARYRPTIVRDLMQEYDFQLKFVVDQPNDIDEIVKYVDAVDPNELSRVLLMPQGVESRDLDEKAKWLEPLAQQHGFSFCPRMHIQWYGNKRGT